MWDLAVRFGIGRWGYGYAMDMGWDFGKLARYEVGSGYGMDLECTWDHGILEWLRLENSFEVLQSNCSPTMESTQSLQLRLQHLSPLQQISTPSQLGAVRELIEGALNALAEIPDQGVQWELSPWGHHL